MNELMTYPIRVAARQSGVSPHLIRMWERRYRAVQPERTDTNRRLYRGSDIERLKLLKKAVADGFSIGHVASMATADLEELVGGEGSPVASPAVAGAAGVDADSLVARAIAFAKEMDAEGLERVLGEAAVTLGRLQAMQGVIEPLMTRIGDMWRDGSLRIADEHLATEVVRRFVDALRRTDLVPAGAPTLIVTTPQGQRHVIGASLVAAQAASEGWRAVFLGADLPALEIAAAAKANDALAVALSVIYPHDDPLLGAELVTLHEALGPVPILVGGRSAHGYRRVLDQIGAVALESLADLRDQLEALRSTRGRP